MTQRAICQYCGAGWNQDQDGMYSSGKITGAAQPFTRNGHFCLLCVHEMANSEAALLAYYDETFQDDTDLVAFMEREKYRFRGVTEQSAPSECRRNDPEEFAELLHGYITKHCRETYLQWVSEKY